MRINLRCPLSPKIALVLIFSLWCAGPYAAVAQTASVNVESAGPLLPESALPAYERELDHAGFIRAWDEKAFARGREIYQLVCHACHGDMSVPGSLPDAMRFAQGTFQHGNDPHALYRTITQGWRQMPPQMQLVPQEKYDVIHYVREAFLKPYNPGQRFEITEEYLARLPAGTAKGPVAVKREPWREMDYGDLLMGTFEIADAADRAVRPPEGSKADYIAPGANLAYKAIALRLDAGEGGIARGRVWVAFEHDTLRVAGIWTGEGFIDWNGINFNGRHVVRPRTIGEIVAETADGPGWADPRTGRFDDERVTGLDGRRYGPLPRTWARYRGLYRHESRAVIAYDVGSAKILESFELESLEFPVVVRTLNIGRSPHDLVFRAANAGAEVSVRGTGRFSRGSEGGFEVVRVAASDTPIALSLRYARPGTPPIATIAPPSADLAAFTHGGPARPPAPIPAPVVRGPAGGAFAIDGFTLPARESNPWRSWLRVSGLDFLPGGDAALLCTWDGDVWRVDGLTSGETSVSWRRVAAGLFQPLGIRIRGDDILVSCRDQIVRLHDRNRDGEYDFFECFNSDHQVTDHFHEFAMGLQSDPAGNLFYAKSARHDRLPVVPHHGTLLKVSADGSQTEILANGFRAANGVCWNPDGTFFVTDQEGHWTPMNRINAVKPGGFYGNMWSYGAPEDSSDSAMERPLCWVDKQFDRSPAELLWVDSKSWGTLDGRLLNLSYGRGRIEIVAHERVGTIWQGGLCVLPIPDFPTGIMRGRFNREDGHLYVCGMSAWGTAQLHLPGGFYRIRATGKPVGVPVAMHARVDGIELTFSDPLDRKVAPEPANFQISTWSLLRSARYGSERREVKAIEVTAASLSADGRTIFLELPGMAPTWQMEIRYTLRSADHLPVEGTFLATIHTLGGL